MKLLCSLPALLRGALSLLAAGFVLGTVIGYRVAEAAAASALL
ncbi:hypothetical protein [Actinokineospora pegani]|nr:hypothetical protein [Actinokineospora pegani]